jgi:allophanate hydrolase subunit 2
MEHFCFRGPVGRRGFSVSSDRVANGHTLAPAASQTQSGFDFIKANTNPESSKTTEFGYRFRSGKPLEFVPREQPFGAGSDPSNIVDACYPYGSIQVPGGTEPIVLHRDAVSGGGYFMVGTVISADMDLIGQLQPHTPARFVEVTMAQALKARKDQAKLYDKIKSSL